NREVDIERFLRGREELFDLPAGWKLVAGRHLENQTVGKNAFAIAQREQPVHQASLVNSQAAQSPIREIRSVGAEVESLFKIFILGLEMLRHEEHALG